MPFPASLQLITLTGTFRDGADSGNPREGFVTIKLPTPIRSQGDNVIIPPFELRVKLVNGAFSVSLPATTDPDWLPNTAQYVIQAVLTDAYTRLWWAIPLPHDTAGATLDLADVGAPNVGTYPSSGLAQSFFDGGYRGTWDTGTLYRTGDTVQHGSANYGALKPSTGVTPGTDATVWKLYPSSGGGGGAVSSVFGRTGDVVAQTNDYTKAQVGLGNVDNTSDAAKPISTATQTALDGKQALDSDLTAIAAIAPANDDVIQRKAGAWTNRTMAQLAADVQGGLTVAESQVTNLVSDLAGKQPLDSDLTTIAGLTATTDNVIQSVAGAWASRTPAQLKSTLALVKGDVGLGNVDNTSDATKFANTALTGTTTAVNLTQSGRYVNTPDALSDAATIATDASLGNHFRVTLGGNRTLGNPTNPVDGQKVMWELIQDGTGSRTLTLDTKFALGTDIAAVTLTTTANKRDFLGAVYNQTADKWYVIAFVKGY